MSNANDIPDQVPEVTAPEPEPEPADSIPELPEAAIQIIPEEPEPEPEEPEELNCQPELPNLVDNEIQPTSQESFSPPAAEGCKGRCRQSDVRSETEGSFSNTPSQSGEDAEPDEAVEGSESEPESEELLQDHEWQERATGFTLSLDEPPPELWTGINDDDDVDYEETDSLQGAAYIQIHGRNFTERLHHTLKHRKERAEAERESAPSHPYLQKSIILCATLVMSLVLAWSALWFLEGLSGMSKRVEREQKVETVAVVSKDPEPQPKKPVPPIEKPPTFADYLNEANHAYNIGMYNRSVIYFFRAHAVNPRDIRPYIGLSNAYRMKGMYFDSKRILDEAQSKFRRNPDIEMGYIFLREEK